MSTTENVLFAILFSILVMTFLYSTVRLIRFIALGRPDPRLRGQWLRRFKTMLLYAFAQRRVVAESFGVNHFFLFWGFLILFHSNMETVFNGLFPDFSF